VYDMRRGKFWCTENCVIAASEGIDGCPTFAKACSGSPVDLAGVGEPHAAFLNESRTRGRWWSPVQEIRIRGTKMMGAALRPLSPDWENSGFQSSLRNLQRPFCRNAVRVRLSVGALPSDSQHGLRRRLLIVALNQPVPEVFDDPWERAAKRFAGGGSVRLPKVSIAVTRCAGQ
jgi:hypothetical protein